MLSKDKTYDVIVIGGGPAGMMAAYTAGINGKSVLLLEKNHSLGKKLLITGGGRCNLTNYKPEMSEFIGRFKDKPKALYSVLAQFGIEDTINFFEASGMPIKIEEEDRVFPESNKSESVLSVFVKSLKENKVEIKTNASVNNIILGKEGDFIIQTSRGDFYTKKCIVATGGFSHPETGSTGDGFKWLERLGHKIITKRSILVPVALKDRWIKDIAGLALQDVGLNVIQDKKIQYSSKGKILFTHFGLSGPAVLNLSSRIGSLLENGKVNLAIDLFPDKNADELKIYFDELLRRDQNKKIKNTLTSVISTRLVSKVLEISEVDPEKFNNNITYEERVRLRGVLKSIELKVFGLLGQDKAIVSSGGIDIVEIDFRTMESKIVPGLYVIGDALNIDRPSGGYSLQICWSTGYVAGESC